MLEIPADTSDSGGPRFTGVIVARVGSSMEYDGNTPDHPASKDDFGSTAWRLAQLAETLSE
jgi:hypothetical protein